MVTGKNLYVNFGKEEVLRDLSFEISPNQHTVFKGDSGSGKTTLLKMLLHFVEPNRGDIKFNKDQPVRALRKHSAWLPQDLDLGEGTVEEVMRVPFTFAANHSNAPEKSRMQSGLNALGVGGNALDKPFRNLSTGQRQRVGLALCHLLDKPVLLLDEPTSALDKTSKQKVCELLIENQPDRTVISTSHDPDWIETADQIIELD